MVGTCFLCNKVSLAQKNLQPAEDLSILPTSAKLLLSHPEQSIQTLFLGDSAFDHQMSVESALTLSLAASVAAAAASTLEATVLMLDALLEVLER